MLQQKSEPWQTRKWLRLVINAPGASHKCTLFKSLVADSWVMAGNVPRTSWNLHHACVHTSARLLRCTHLATKPPRCIACEYYKQNDYNHKKYYFACSQTSCKLLLNLHRMHITILQLSLHMFLKRVSFVLKLMFNDTMMTVQVYGTSQNSTLNALGHIYHPVNVHTAEFGIIMTVNFTLTA